MKLLLFNPETEYALASGASFYTPPARVEKLRKESQLLPEKWAKEGDIILVDNTEGLISDFRLAEWNDLESIFSENPELEIEPWGWNSALVRKLKDHGVPVEKLPNDSAINMIRALAHRRTTVVLTSLWNETVEAQFRIEAAKELKNIEECMDFYHANPGCWMKAPWSSSGRGVINTAADMTEILVEQWCRGILRRQGSVMGEKGADRKSDYATEWMMKDGIPEYLGLSSFSTTNRGKYISNHIISQSEMRLKFDAESKVKIEDVVRLQKDILQNVMRGYEGLMGVDMIVKRDGSLIPFVEVNLRRTMGMLHIME